MQTTPNFGIPYPQPGEHTRTWEFWQGMAESLDGLLAPFVTPDDVITGREGQTTEVGFISRLTIGGDHYTAKLGAVAGGKLALILSRNGVEVSRLELAPDGSVGQAAARPLPHAMWAGQVTVGAIAAGGYAMARATFPAGRFTAVPIVVATSQNSAMLASTANSATTGVEVYARMLSGTSTGGAIWVQAVQMRPTSGAG